MNPPRRALVIVDVQNEYFHGPLEIQHPPKELSIANITRLIDHADSQGVPIVVLQHSYPAGAPVFAEGSPGWELHPEVAARVKPHWKQATKQFGTIFGGTDIAEWLKCQDIDTITIAGYMTNNCDLATAAEAEVRGLSAEIVSDATGAIHLSNAAGKVAAEQLHNTLMVLMHSNFAAVTTTQQWIAAVTAGEALDKGNLPTSAVDGAQSFGA